MMEIPEISWPLFNEQNIYLMQVKHVGEYHFKNADNQEFFLQIEEFQKKFVDMEIYWETMVALGVATGSPELIRYAKG